jgi:hypothetical protein
MSGNLDNDRINEPADTSRLHLNVTSGATPRQHRRHR